MSTIWILVANQAQAKIYSTSRIPGTLVLMGTLKHPEGAAHAGDLGGHAPGRAYNRTGPARHGIEPETSVKEEGRRRFVKEIVGRLQTAHLRGEFQRLVLLAAPAVLGVIRKTLNGDIVRTVIKEIPKDVVSQGPEKVHMQLVRSFTLK